VIKVEDTSLLPVTDPQIFTRMTQWKGIGERRKTEGAGGKAE